MPENFPDALHETYDLIVANIIADVMPRLPLPFRIGWQKTAFIASGIIKDKFTYVETAARQAGLELLVQRERSEWCAAVFRRIDWLKDMRHGGPISGLLMPIRSVFAILTGVGLFSVPAFFR